MKKKTILLCSLAVFMLAVSFTGCEDDSDSAKDQSATVNLFGGTTSKVTVQGYMTNAQWDGVANKIASRLNTAYDEGADDLQAGFRTVFDRGVTYTVEVNPVGYTNFKTNGDGKTVYIALSAVDTSYVSSAVGVLYNNDSYISP